MGLRFSHGKRRRRIQVYSTSLPAAAAGVSFSDTTTLVPVVRRPAAQSVRMPIIAKTVYPTGTVGPPPPPGGGGSATPPPLVVVRDFYRQGSRYPRPLILRSTRDRVPIDGSPNQVFVPVQRVGRSVQPTPVTIRRGKLQALPTDGTPNQVIVPVQRPNRRPSLVIRRSTPPPPRSTVEPPIDQTIIPVPSRRRPNVPPLIRKTIATTGLGFVPPNDPVIASYVKRQHRTRKPIISSPQSGGSVIRPNPLQVIQNVAPLRRSPPTRAPIVIRRAPLAGNATILSRYILVPPQKRLSPARFPIVVRSRKTTQQNNLGGFDPLIVPVTRRRLPLSLPITAQRTLVDNSVAQHFPMPKTSIVQRPTRRPGMWPTPIAIRSEYQDVNNISDAPWDIIAASIAWLRADPTTVSNFGDDFASGIVKFTSDIEPRDIDPPYAVFYEPQEVEVYETDGNTDVPKTTLIEGMYRIEVFSTGKLLTRQLSERIGMLLNDAPLHFTLGLLMYLRRTQRVYPTLEVPGTGTNIVMFKRMIEFEYKFEKLPI